MTKTTKKSSAKRKLIPAVGMLTTSAIMLSSATYAWFTMNKEVQVTGIEMTATTSDALEISLGSVTKETNALDVTANPTDKESEASWTNVIDVAQYYSYIGLVKPSSTNNCATMYEALDPTNGGQTASLFAVATNGTNMLLSRATYDKAGTLTAIVDDDYSDETKKGFYVDIPVHLRTSKVATSTKTNSNVICAMDIKDIAGKAGDGDLYKAVRVAFINDADKNQSVSIGEAVSDASGSIWGVNNTYYHAGGVSSINETGLGSFATTTIVTDRTGAKNINIPIPLAATSGEYGHADFIMRIWLEGESTYCLDKNAAQDWQIDLKFALEGEATTSFVESTWTDADFDKTRDEVENS